MLESFNLNMVKVKKVWLYKKVKSTLERREYTVPFNTKCYDILARGTAAHVVPGGGGARKESAHSVALLPGLLASSNPIYAQVRHALMHGFFLGVLPCMGWAVLVIEFSTTM
jgi:hypothetical protein